MSDGSSDAASAGDSTDEETARSRSPTSRNRGAVSSRARASDRGRALGRLLVVLGLGVVPWTVVAGVDLTFVFPFGLLNDDPWTLVTLPDYLRLSVYGRSAAIESWLVGAGIYVGAVASALAGVAGWDDRRLTGGLLVLAALNQFPLAYAFSRRPGTLAVPFGSVLLLIAAWWLYWPAVIEWVDERTE
ncbi:TIGR04206 family protein [Halomarina salina]|uniref:TIGR04206 family protein n=1 Tax=Halomarina salina TaxID=1872699 RepID=A0ABD5RH21_9EURY